MGHLLFLYAEILPLCTRGIWWRVSVTHVYTVLVIECMPFGKLLPYMYIYIYMVQYITIIVWGCLVEEG